MIAHQIARARQFGIPKVPPETPWEKRDGGPAGPCNDSSLTGDFYFAARKIADESKPLTQNDGSNSELALLKQQPAKFMEQLGRQKKAQTEAKSERSRFCPQTLAPRPKLADVSISGHSGRLERNVRISPSFVRFTPVSRR